MDYIQVLSKGLKALVSERGRQALRHGVAATGVHRSLLSELSPSFVIDVGGNRGQFGLDVWAACPKARLLAFEPLSEAASTYQQIFTQHPDFEIRFAAVGSAPGNETLHISASDDSSSLFGISDLQSETFPGTKEAATRTVPVTTIDIELAGMELPSLVLLKADVQGAEFEVVKGAAGTLSKIKWVYLECSFREFYKDQALAGELVAHLQGEGFELTGIGPSMKVAGVVVQADLLFTNTQL